MSKRFRRKLLFSIALAVGIIGAVLFVFAFGGLSLEKAPFPLVHSPMVVFRLGPYVDPRDPAQQGKPTLHGFLVEEQHVVNDPQLEQSASKMLDSRFIYGMDDDLCFEPGFAIRFGDGPAEVDALICLECRHVYFYRDAELHARNLNGLGESRLERLYTELFPAAAAQPGNR